MRRTYGETLVVAWVLGALTFLGSVPAAGAACLSPAGDLTGDGATNVADVQCLISTAIWDHLGKVDPQPTCLAGAPTDADLDCDGSLYVQDVQIAILLSLNMALPAVLDADADGCVDGCAVAGCGALTGTPEDSWWVGTKRFARWTWAGAGITNNGKGNAAAFCASLGGTLARPNSTDEWTALKVHLPADSNGWWIDGHNNFTCGQATVGSPKPYEFGDMYVPLGQDTLYTGCNCTAAETGLVAYIYTGTGAFDGCEGNGGTTNGMLGVMDEMPDYAHANILGFVCEFSCAAGTARHAYCDWARGAPCANTGTCGSCDPAVTPGYYYRGKFNGYHCWYHTYNQEWNVNVSTNINALALAFGLDPTTASSQWCVDFGDIPVPPFSTTSYNTPTNVGAWGCCSGGFTAAGGAGGFVCILDNGSAGGICAGGTAPNGMGGTYVPPDPTGTDRKANAMAACESFHGAGNCCDDGCGSCNAHGYHLCGAPNCNGSTYWNYDNTSQDLGCGWVDPNEILISVDGVNWTQ